MCWAMGYLQNICSKCTPWKVMFILFIFTSYFGYTIFRSDITSVIVGFYGSGKHDNYVDFRNIVTMATPIETTKHTMNSEHSKSNTSVPIMSRFDISRLALLKDIQERFHQSRTKDFTNELNRTDNIDYTTEVNCKAMKFLVYKCTSVCGGWGDRQKGIISSFLLALLTNRTFVIEMNSPCSIETFLKPSNYDWTKCKPFVTQLDKSDVIRIRSMDGNKLFPNRLSLTNFDALWTRRVVFFRTNKILINSIRKHPSANQRLKWSNKLTNAEMIRLVLGILFRPNDRLVLGLKHFFTRQIHNRTLICSHIRFGRNPSNPRDSELKQGTPNVTTVLSFLKRFDDTSKRVFYIATDALAIRERAAIELTNVLTAGRSVVHIDKVKKTKEACDGFYTVLFEQLILSKCDSLILTRSNMGAMAAYMRGRSDKLYIYDKRSNSIRKVSINDIQGIYRFS